MSESVATKSEDPAPPQHRRQFSLRRLLISFTLLSFACRLLVSIWRTWSEPTFYDYDDGRIGYSAYICVWVGGLVGAALGTLFSRDRWFYGFLIGFVLGPLAGLVIGLLAYLFTTPAR